jgi:hypothetical protein
MSKLVLAPMVFKQKLVWVMSFIANFCADPAFSHCYLFAKAAFVLVGLFG